ncbi:MAG: hypothetical protein BROFUL_01158 [Candidatus Brocadia fulgida]|uniref:Uncharacterized protein n=1 Tax=Candidatus Brocadia fulgida TaxID=380242 RepID=A0A0M2UVQ9_9BACT|nr:MAG: hypothetical protein BROFUL_01158 [Candidatus Brocadia fulgida]
MNKLLKLDQFSNRVDQEDNLHEKAFFFHHEGKKLFGILHLPLNKSGIQRKMGIVMCHPCLIEPLITQRLEVNIYSESSQNVIFETL